jgi:two-component system sensor histidine kinase/response regulator
MDYAGASVLLIDDEPMNLKALRRILQRQNYVISTAELGQEGIDKATETLPDIIVLDLVMPDVNGFDVCKTLKANPRTQHIPILFLSGKNDTQNIVKAFRVGGVDYITKPFNMEEVEVRIQTHLTLKFMREELEAFGRMVAHDIKNPLNVIMGMASLLQGESDIPERHQEDLKAMVESSRRISQITDSMFTLSRSSTIAVEIKPVNMQEVVARSIKFSTDIVADFEGIVRLDSPENWPRCLGHAPWLEQVWANFIGNAMKYGGRPPQVVIGADPVENNQVRFWIRDNGPGLSSEEKDRIFEEFVQIPRKGVSGHGIGLAIVQRIIQKLGGQIGITCESDKGSEFYFTLFAAP